MVHIAKAAGKGVVAVCSCVLGNIVWSMESVTTWLRLAALILGVLGTLGTLISICFDIRWKWRHRNDSHRSKKRHLFERK